ncbi:hypothetical protein HN51_026471, partial [Arachis hypogaea]
IIVPCDFVERFLRTFKMLAIDPATKLSFNRLISNGDLVIVYERHDNLKAVTVSESTVLQNRFGVFKHSEWIGKPFGSKVFSNKGGFVYLLAPTPELWTLVLSHRTQILYIADISFVIMYLEVVPGCLQRAGSARDDFERTGLSSLISVRVRDIQGEGFPSEFAGLADAVFLDLPQPWLAIPSAAEMLKQDGTLCSFSPCVEQVQRSCETLQNSFTDIRTFEVLLRTYEVREGKMENLNGDNNGSNGSLPCKRRQRSNGSYAPDSIVSSVMARPCGEARGHTDYLTFARLK